MASVQKATGIAPYKWANYYWSSSESYNNPTYYAWCLDFDYGDVYGGGKDSDYYVRSVLAF